MPLKLFLLFLYIVSLLSCQSKASSQATENTTLKTDSLYQTGIVLNDIPLPGYPEESVALYIPKQFSASKHLPLIIFLDPHGAGELPLQKYQQLADQYQVILAGSNNCKNEIPFEKNLQFAEHIINQIHQCIAFDSTKLALSGFSGGAKLALIEGFHNPAVSTIIYTGAVVPIESTQNSKQLIGFAGERDMNYTDLIQFNRSLPNNIPHALINWNGKHEWPDATIFTEAFTNFINGTLSANKAYVPNISDAQVEKEQQEKQNYLQAFQQKDLNWWKNAIQSLNDKKTADPMYERLLGFISLACYSFAGSSLQQHNLTAAKKIVTIYLWADPQNKDAQKFRMELEKQGIKP
jgi:predicted esterase